MPMTADGSSTTQPLLGHNNDNNKSSSSPDPQSQSYGSTFDNNNNKKQQYPRASGYELSPEGLANVVAQRQLGALDAFGLEGLAAALGTSSLNDGLSSSDDDDQVSRQRDLYGSNRLPPPPEPSLLALCLEELKDTTILMLLGSAVVSLILGLLVERDFQHGWIEGTSIIVTVNLVISVSAMTDYVKAKEFREQQLSLENEKHVQVLRDGGSSKQIHPRDLVVGDVIRLAVGDICPVDGVLVDGTHVKMDESALTGESNLIEKQVYKNKNKDGASDGDVDPFIVSGTNVMQGSGKMLVLAVGTNSMQGKILARIREQEQQQNGAGRHEQEEGGGGCCSNMGEFCKFGGGDDGADLMEKLDILAVDIGKLGLIVAGLVFLVMLGEWLHVEFILGGRCGMSEEEETEADCLEWSMCAFEDGKCHRKWVAADLSTVLEYFITAVTILVVAVPEGLPLAVTLALAVSMRRMMRDNNQVKNMDSCETMGSATTICSDKTGTLTENKMTVMRALVGGQDYEYIVGQQQGSKHQNLGELILETSSNNNTDALSKLLSEAILLNTNPTAKVLVREDGGIKYEGNATDCALIKLALQMGYEAQPVRQSYREEGSTLDWGVYTIPFSSEKKRMSWIVQSKQGPKKYRMYSKGAPKQMFNACKAFVSDMASGKTNARPLTRAEQRSFEDKIADYQNVGMRTLAVAFRDFDSPPKGGWDKDPSIEGDLTLLGVFGIEDPLRESVPGAIAECRKAGIDVRMCTGDALTTGVAIAKGCGILRSSDLDKDGQPKKNYAMTGAEFDDLIHRKDFSKPKVMRRVFDPATNDAVNKLAEPFRLDESGNKMLDQAAFDEVWPTLRVLARCQPEDKLALVRGMRKSRVFMDQVRCDQLKRDHSIEIFPDFQVVAVTGDGTNDAPALQCADVGFAMGIVGTETAKQACDIILLDDNFASIVKAVMWGRNVFDSISKFLQFQLTVNVVAITLAVIGAFVYSKSPLSAVQMLWVNMIMDSLASLALATELPTKELLDRMPYGKHRQVISNVMSINIIGHACFQIAVLCWILFAPETLPLDPPIQYEPNQGSHHWSLVFNVFVMLQLFNEFNSRRLVTAEKLRTTWSEWNIFQGFLSNPIFVGVMLSTFGLQMLIVEFGGIAVNVVPGGLTRNQWLFSVVVGASGLVWQVFINILVTLFFATSADVELKKAKKRVPSMAELESAERLEPRATHWDKLRLGVRQGFLYSRMLKMDIKAGIKLATLIKTKKTYLLEQDNYKMFYRDVSSRRLNE